MGVLRSRSSIRFIYTPKHRSWLNQIERWFSISIPKSNQYESHFHSVEDLAYLLIH
ncbi:hypothetical protein DT065_10795 [Salicibibacter kimchii]|uniref:Uncharacterized protein n=1 Tax=Salicibibacter kimchii TaxID=2099786 RepID=A0A345BZT1_9BACI|nr:hypothetical protein DT065_10795 [Salicibibacter kimchii]